MDSTNRPSAPRNRSGSSPPPAGERLWTRLQHCTLFSSWRSPVGGGFMRIAKFLAATLLLALALPCVADEKDKANPDTQDKPAQATSFDQVVDRVTSREQQFLVDLK